MARSAIQGIPVTCSYLVIENTNFAPYEMKIFHVPQTPRRGDFRKISAGCVSSLQGIGISKGLSRDLRGFGLREDSFKMAQFCPYHVPAVCEGQWPMWNTRELIPYFIFSIITSSEERVFFEKNVLFLQQQITPPRFSVPVLRCKINHRGTFAPEVEWLLSHT